MLVAQGHDLAGLAEIAVELKTEKELEYTKEATSDGIMRNVGGASMTLYAPAISFDEAELLLNQLGLTLQTPSAYVTVGVPDPFFRHYTLYYGVVTINANSTDNGWLTNFRIEFTGLTEVA